MNASRSCSTDSGYSRAILEFDTNHFERSPAETRRWTHTFAALALLCSGCVIVDADTDGRVRYISTTQGVYCSGDFEQNQHRCSVNSRQLLEELVKQGSEKPGADLWKR